MEALGATEFAVVMLLLRVAFGVTFASHGWAKRFGGGGISGTAGWFDSIGMKPGRVHAQLASLTELAAGIALALGLFTTLASAAVIGVMVVAGWTVHRSNGFAIVSNGWEYTFITALVAWSIAGLGPGEWSLDNALGLPQLDGYQGLAIAGILGVAAGVAQILVFFRPPAE